MGEYRERALGRGAAWAAVVPASYVVTAPWVRYKCCFGCSSYGTRHLCPPATPTPAETAAVIKSYRRALLVVYEFTGQAARRARRPEIHRDLIALERDAFLDGYYRALAFVAGPCNLCRSCDISEPCSRPGEPRPSMEACGIDVFATMAHAGFKLEVVRSLDAPYRLCGLLLLA